MGILLSNHSYKYVIFKLKYSVNELKDGQCQDLKERIYMGKIIKMASHFWSETQVANKQWNNIMIKKPQ